MLFFHFIVNLCAREHAHTHTGKHTLDRPESHTQEALTQTYWAMFLSIASLLTIFLSAAEPSHGCIKSDVYDCLFDFSTHLYLLAASCSLPSAQPNFCPPTPTRASFSLPACWSDGRSACWPGGLSGCLTLCGWLFYTCCLVSANTTCPLFFTWSYPLWKIGVCSGWGKCSCMFDRDREREIARGGSQSGSVASFQVDWILCLCVFMRVNFHVSTTT